MSTGIKWAVASTLITTVYFSGCPFFPHFLQKELSNHFCHCGEGGRRPLCEETSFRVGGVHGEYAKTLKLPSETEEEADHFLSFSNAQYFAVNLVEKRSACLTNPQQIHTQDHPRHGSIPAMQ